MNWKDKLGASFEQLWADTLELLPGVLVALAVLAVGWLVAGLLRRIAVRLTSRSARQPAAGPAASPIERLAAEAVGHAVFWLVLLASVVVAGEVLGFAVLSQTLGRLARFLPSVVAALLVVVAGIFLARLARRAVRGAAAKGGMARADLLGEAARISTLTVAVVIALDQIGVESTLLILMFAILLGAIFGSFALAFALGARAAVGDAIAAHYVAQRYRVGDRVRLASLQGRIVELTRNAVLLDTDEGRALVPAAEFGRATSILVKD